LSGSPLRRIHDVLWLPVDVVIQSFPNVEGHHQGLDGGIPILLLPDLGEDRLAGLLEAVPVRTFL